MAPDYTTRAVRRVRRRGAVGVRCSVELGCRSTEVARIRFDLNLTQRNLSLKA